MLGAKCVSIPDWGNGRFREPPHLFFSAADAGQMLLAQSLVCRKEQFARLLAEALCLLRHLERSGLKPLFVKLKGPRRNRMLVFHGERRNEAAHKLG